jgi:hypothetical protein
MTTRRSFIKTLAAIAPAMSIRRGWAASADPTRVAMVIGNSAYRVAPLPNPVNDARVMAELFGQAGFTVDSRLDATRADLVAAVERLGIAARRPETRQVVFYYAGHGVQLDWRNYLLPVDAEVESVAQVKERCVDLGLLLGLLSGGKDKTFIVILDACRDDPFGGAYRPQQKGLSQFDAPVGSLLAYATSPGSVAADGAGKNGLYTENLVRELSARGTRIEDAFKRVRLNVRLTSRGGQIPWETTSLEDDVFLFNDAPPKLSEAELERLIEADLAQWAGIKSSRNVDDWVAYLRKFPNGRFAEIAQVRLGRLLAETERPVAVSAIAPDPMPTTVPSTAGTSVATRDSEAGRDAAATAPIAVSSRPAALPAWPAIELAFGVTVPPLLGPSANPYSAGHYPLGRNYTVGDRATFRESDLLTGLDQRVYTLRVTGVDQDADRVEINDGRQIWDTMGNPIKRGNTQFDVPQQFSPAELQVGRKWTAAFKGTEDGRANSVSFDLHITRRETVSVPAGKFEAFRVEGHGWNWTNGHRLELTMWLVPGLNFLVKYEHLVRTHRGQLVKTERHELVSLRQQAINRADGGARIR